MRHPTRKPARRPAVPERPVLLSSSSLPGSTREGGTPDRPPKRAPGGVAGVVGSFLVAFISVFAFTTITLTVERPARANDDQKKNAPVLMNEGDPAPFRGILTTLKDTARLTAQTLDARADLAECESELAEVPTRCDESIKEAVAPVQSELSDCMSRQVPPTEVVKEVPWWAWAGWGASLVVVAVVAGWVGSSL